jgi:hypothetical protein
MHPKPIRVDGDVAYVPLTRGYEAVIDAADADVVGQYRWHAVPDLRADRSVRSVYAFRTLWGSGRKTALHRLILTPPAGMVVDHISGDGLDNRKSNLRIASVAENQRNKRLRIDSKSGHKGVFWSAQKSRWIAEIYADGEKIRLGFFRNIDQAAAAYERASLEFHGEFGRTA